MPIWFVYRSPYDGPMSKHVQRLEGADTLVDWFRLIWRAIPDRDQAYAYARELLGTDVYSFGFLFIMIAEESLSPPETDEEVHSALEGALYVGGEYRGTADTIQVLTDDDELSMAMYWFTDTFAKARPERVAYLLREDWRLPEGVGRGGYKPIPGVRRLLPRTEGQKALYLVDLYWGDSCDLEDLCGAEKLPEMRLSDLLPWLMGLSIPESENFGGIVANLREYLEKILNEGEDLEGSFRRALREQPQDRATWSAYTDWLAERDLPPAEFHLLEQAVRAFAGRNQDRYATLRPDLLQVGPHHLALMLPRRSDNEFDQWFLFDDVWASGNVDLANALLDYALRFNVLDAWDEENEYGPDIPPGEERGPEGEE